MRRGINAFVDREDVRAEMQRLGAVRLTPGMPVEAFIQTQPRTVLSFFTKPLVDQVARAFREK